MDLRIASEPGSQDRPNEDFAAVALPAACGRGGALLELSASRRDMALRDCLAEAIARTAADHRETCDLSHTHTPQATVVAVRWDENAVEHLVLCDSVLLLAGAGDHPGGAVRAVRDDRLSRLPPEVLRLRDAVRALPPGSPERAALGAEYGRAVEALRNADGVPGAFFTAAADPAVAGRAVTGTTPRGRLRAVAALTDGAARLVEVFGSGDWSAAMALLGGPGPAELIRRVRAAEDADPRCRRFPRGKARDDATAVFWPL